MLPSPLKIVFVFDETSHLPHFVDAYCLYVCRQAGVEDNLAMYSIVAGLWSAFYALGYVDL